MTSVGLMKSSKSVRSVTSRSSKNLKSTCSMFVDPLLPTLEEVLPQVCQKYDSTYNVFVKKEFQQDEFLQQLKKPERAAKYKKITMIPTAVSVLEMSRIDTKTITTTTSEVSYDEDAVAVTTFYDNVHNLTEIKLCNVHVIIPRSLIQIIRFLSSSYDYLTKITITRCRINATIIYELAKMLSMGFITDVCLDGSPVPEGNYYILLDNSNNCLIKNLSLSRCKVNDEVCKQIATRLHFTCSAEKSLQVLNLSSNHITDEGAKHLATALRSNRRLRYLNLADNRIGDDAACLIFESLKDFRLTFAEDMERKKRYVSYLRAKNTLVDQYLKECENKPTDDSNQTYRKQGKRRKTSATSLKSKGNINKNGNKKDKVDYYKAKAEQYALEILGPIKDPFDRTSIKVVDKTYCYSLGNTVLCYLNLSYNQLGYISVKKLLSVLQYQRIVKKPTQVGLMKVVIEGNPMPINCVEYQNINEIFRSNKNMQQYSGRMSIAGLRRKSMVQGTRISVLPPQGNLG